VLDAERNEVERVCDKKREKERERERGGRDSGVEMEEKTEGARAC